MSRISIRWRVALWNTTAFAIVLLAFGVLVYTLLRGTHFAQIDKGLLARTTQVLSDPKLSDEPKKRFSFWVRKFGKHVEISGVVLNPAGEIIAQAQSLSEIASTELTAATAAEPIFDSLNVPQFGHARCVRVRVPTAEGPYTLMLFAEMEHVDEELLGVIHVLFVTIPVSIFVAAALSYFLAYKALAPVEQLSRLSNEISAERLDRRLPIPNPNDELGHLARTINSMIARLEKSFEEVRRFTGDASHELRTPITVIRSEAEIGVDVANDADDARCRFQSILEECDRLTSATSQLLTLSRSEAGTVRRIESPVDLRRLLQEIVDGMQPRAAAKRQTLSLHFDGEATIMSDSEGLRQIFYNLVDNAIKYSPEGGMILVRLTSSSAEAIVDVRDNGIGIAEENVSRVFDRFYRINSSGNEDGVGLGLSIVKSILDSIDGSIELTSSDTGTVFRVMIPTASSPEGQTQPQSTSSPMLPVDTRIR